MAKRTITQRWLFNTVGLVSIILLTIVIAFAFITKNYYYSSVKQYMTSKMNMISSVLVSKVEYNNTSITTEVRTMVEGFSDKDKLELMAINQRGRVAITSSGFTPEDPTNIPDYQVALESSDNIGTFVGKQYNGESIMAITYILSTPNSEYDAVRLVVSLKEINRLILIYTLAITVVAIAILMFIVYSGLYFVNSIVIPVRQIGATARQFAAGDFSFRIVKKNDDEIGELCDIINFMANEISNNEAMKNEFISSVSHELRTPLTAIKGWSETLEGIDDQATIQKGMRVIGSETERLSQMVEELLDFSRIQDGRFTLVKTTMDILAELGEAVLIYAERAKRENIEVIYDEPEMLPFVYGDKNRLRQVFINIIDNAVKYSDPGGVVSIQATAEDDTVQIAISDTGCGISEIDIPKIKTKFYKANHSRRGSGIGLAVADEIITMHNGQLDILSEQGVGTTVIITLPAIMKKNEATKYEGLIETVTVDERNNDNEQSEA